MKKKKIKIAPKPPPPQTRKQRMRIIAEAGHQFSEQFAKLGRNIAKLEALRDGSYMEKYWRASYFRIGWFATLILCSLILPWCFVSALTALAICACGLFSTCSLLYLTRDRSWDKWFDRPK